VGSLAVERRVQLGDPTLGLAECHEGALRQRSW
jgi:hypothetical protein